MKIIYGQENLLVSRAVAQQHENERLAEGQAEAQMPPALHPLSLKKLTK